MSKQRFITVATDRTIPAPDGYASSVVFGVCEGVYVRGVLAINGKNPGGMTAEELAASLSTVNTNPPAFVRVSGIMVPVGSITGICDGMVPPEGSINASGLDLEEILQTQLDALQSIKRANTEEAQNH